MPNTYRAVELATVLKQDIGFCAIVESHENIYLGQSYFVAAKK
jgi:hypothetical protein